MPDLPKVLVIPSSTLHNVKHIIHSFLSNATLRQHSIVCWSSTGKVNHGWDLYEHEHLATY